MRQLVELGKNKEAFAEAGADVIAVFREEKEGEAGLKKIVARTKTTFELALDGGNKQTSRYSTGRREFTGYVINTDGVITNVFEGDLRNRATSAELIKALKALGEPAEDSKAEGSDSKSDESTTGSKTKASDAAGSAAKEAGSDDKSGGSGNK